MTARIAPRHGRVNNQPDPFYPAFILIQTKSKSSQDPLNFPIKLNNQIAALAGVVSRGNFGPTDQTHAVLEDLSAKLDVQLSALQGIIESDVAAFNGRVQKERIPAVIVKP